MIYRQLEIYLYNIQTKEISAMIAFLLSSVSRLYFDDICQSVGYGISDPGKQDNTLKHPRVAPFVHADEEDESAHDIEEENTNFPCFFSQTFSQSLARSRKSLRLLRVAQPDHPLLGGSGPSRRRIRWIWTHNEIMAAWNDGDTSSISSRGDLHPKSDICDRVSVTMPNGPKPTYLVEIQDFTRFDLEPGTSLTSDISNSTSHPASTFGRFFQTFPEKLSSVTPCLSDLTDLVLSPLAFHIDLLSSTLVNTFLLPSRAYLRFQSHITLLRSYLLLTSPAFKTRLQSALFTTSPDSEDPTMMAHARRHTQRRAPTLWVIGLSSALTESNHWPPAGADLSYLLRTVIIDSLDDDYPRRQLNRSNSLFDDGEQAIYDEAEWRIGFAIRDLPVGSGQAKWLNPRCTSGFMSPLRALTKICLGIE